MTLTEQAAADEGLATDLRCGHRSGPRSGTCGSTDGLVRLAVGWMCRDHTLPGAQVLEVGPGPLLVDVDVAPLARVSVPPPDLIHRLPDPGRSGSAVQLDGQGAAAQAAAMVWGKTGKPRRRLIDRFIEIGDHGMTSWEAWRWYCDTYGPIDLYTLRPRLTELKTDGWIQDSGRRRHPRGNGDPAAPAEEVLVLTHRGRLQAGTR